MKPVARVGDKHICPLHGPNVVVEGGSSIAGGMPVARVGDKCACGGVIVEGDVGALCDGRPVAYLGSKTSCGGIILATYGNGWLGA